MLRKGATPVPVHTKTRSFSIFSGNKKPPSGPFELQARAFLHALENILGTARAGLGLYDTKLEAVRAVGRAGNGIAAPALQALLANGKVHRDELPRPKIKGRQRRNLYHHAPDVRGDVIYFPDNAFVPSNHFFNVII
jgi:hypothetical protein